MKLVKKCLIAFNNQWTNKITKKEVDNDVDFRFTLLDMQKFAKYYHKQKLTLTDVGGSYSKKQVDDAYDKGFKDAMLKYRK
tara:strand:- start:610 stop:852 length:243 start_codon:yes stop_codon:yes gene_type:complete